MCKLCSINIDNDEDYSKLEDAKCEIVENDNKHRKLRYIVITLIKYNSMTITTYPSVSPTYTGFEEIYM